MILPATDTDMSRLGVANAMAFRTLAHHRAMPLSHRVPARAEPLLLKGNACLR
jgi:hypothetical protein